MIIVNVDGNAETEDVFSAHEKEYRDQGYLVRRKFVETRLTGETVAHSAVEKDQERFLLVMLRDGKFLSVTTFP